MVIYASADEERASLAKAIEEYEKTAPAKYKTDVVSKANHTWAEVVQAASAVRDDHYRINGLRHKMTKKLGRLVTDHGPMLSAWAEILPSQNEYFSVLCGGLKLVFGVRFPNLVQCSLLTIQLGCGQAAKD